MFQSIQARLSLELPEMSMHCMAMLTDRVDEIQALIDTTTKEEIEKFDFEDLIRKAVSRQLQDKLHYVLHDAVRKRSEQFADQLREVVDAKFDEMFNKD